MQSMQSATHLLNLKLVDELPRGIKVKTRVSNGIIYQPGDSVYYKKEIPNMWKGPIAAIACKHKQIIVKHGRTHIRVHMCQ